MYSRGHNSELHVRYRNHENNQIPIKFYFDYYSMFTLTLTEVLCSTISMDHRNDQVNKMSILELISYWSQLIKQ